MTREEILEYNKRCAEFLGWTYISSIDVKEGKYHKSIKAGWYTKVSKVLALGLTQHFYKGRSHTSLKFDSDWNWIMEVCISIGMEFVTTNKEQLIQQIYDKLRSILFNKKLKINMKYLLKQNKEDKGILCDKITIDGFDYYVSDEKLKDGDYCVHPTTLNISQHSFDNNLRLYWKKVIATNKLDIDIPKVANEVEILFTTLILLKDDRNIFISDEEINRYLDAKGL